MSDRSTARTRITPATRQRNRALLLGCIAFGAFTAIFPVYWLKNRATQVDASSPLAKNMAVRGQYVNSSAQDVGPDPMTGKYVRRVYPAGKTIKSLSEVKAERESSQQPL